MSRRKPWQPRVGDSWRIVYQPGNPNNRTIHIRAIVDGGVIVYVVHSKEKGWSYQIADRWFFDLLWDAGQLKRSASKRLLRKISIRE